MARKHVEMSTTRLREFRRWLESEGYKIHVSTAFLEALRASNHKGIIRYHEKSVQTITASGRSAKVLQKFIKD